ncbi:MAG: ATP-binding protein [Candidatus Omnitrophica bacterium]|nr:ATP-binding protein [Candidatus Omnitrophota bacterium]
MTDKQGEEKKIYMKVPGDTGFLGLVRKAIVELGLKTGFDPDDLAQVEMAVDEACANIMNHAYSPDKNAETDLEKNICVLNNQLEDGSDRPVELRININQERLLVELKDKGRSFDFDKKGDLDLDEYFSKMEVGGLGVYIMKTFMDKVFYEYIEGEGNKLQMIKYLRREDHADRV